MRPASYKKTLVFCTIGLLLTACAKRTYHTEIELLSGDFKTPEGNFEIYRDAGLTPHWGTCNQYKNLMSSSGKVDLFLCIHGSKKTGGVIKLRHSKTGIYSFSVDKFDYQRNDIVQPVIIRGEATGETGQKEYIFTADGRSSILFSLPGTLAYAPSHAKPLQSDIHRLNLSFNLDGEKFFVDASFHIKVVYDGLKWEIPVPTGGLP